MKVHDVTIQITEVDSHPNRDTPAQAVVEVTVEDANTGLTGSRTVSLRLLDPDLLFQAIDEATTELRQRGPFAKAVGCTRTIIEMGSGESFCFRLSATTDEDLDRLIEWLNRVLRKEREE